MQRDESLIFSILRLLRSRAPGSIEESQIVHSFDQRSAARARHVNEQLQLLLASGMLKQIKLARNKTAYTLDWPGYDYLEGH